MMTSAVLLIGFFFVLGAFGYTVSTRLLRIQNTLGIAGLTFVLGPTTFITLSNALGYALPIKTVFPLTLGLLGAIALYLYKTLQGGEPREIPPKNIIWAFSAIIALVGFAFARVATSDAWTLGHFPIPATIMEGNFPVTYTTNPFERISYHYGHAMLIAGISSVTHIPLALSYVLQTWINVAGSLLFGGAIAWSYTKSWKGALLCGSLALAGAGLFWLNGIWLIKDIFENYILKIPIEPQGETAFRWLTYAIHNSYGNGILMRLGHKPIATGVAIFFALLYIIMEMLQKKKVGISWILVAIILGSALALSLETSFVILYAAAIVTVLLALLHKLNAKHVCFTLISILLPVLFIAFYQGGVFGNLSGETGVSSFVLNFDGRIHYHAGVEKWTVALWEWKFFRDFGLHLAMIIAAYVFFLRRKRIDTFLLLLFSLTAGHFLAPLFVQFTPREHEMNRLFVVFFGLSSLLAGLYLWESKLKFRSILIICMLLAGMLSASVHMVFPTLNLERAPLFPTMPPVTPAEKAVHKWVAENTTINDIFFLHAGNTTPERWKNRVTFIAHTGRFSIGFGFENAKPEFAADMKQLEDACDEELMRNYHIAYLLIQTKDRAQWYSRNCNARAWELKYDGGSGENAYPRIYRLIQSS